ncbi:MAG: hypothetical protein AUG51_20250 [Acidobacteria bacterium 13_1_20CM_3_53_8]|nr:MAG: hypothetical protein AUG51_20250 [Acidobacteria bacterium 13_1_20CM_3_53_8]
MKKSFLVFYLTLSLLHATLPLTRVSAVQTASAQTNAPASRSIQLPGLRQRVTVSRDERGIPYIEAANDSDLYFAQGYTTASDRLWQMELFRRTARGELAEIFGKAALNEDKRHRTLGFGRLADAQAAQLPPKLRAALEDYARGVNAYIATLNDNNTPPEFKILQLKPRAWTAADSIVTSKLFDETLSTSWNQDITRGRFTDLPQTKHDALFPEISPLDVIIVGSDNPPKKRKTTVSLIHHNENASSTVDDATVRAALDDTAVMERSLGRIGFYAENCAASNNWVIDGRHTLTGKPLLANDPHLQASAPSIWYMINLSAPGFHAAGVAVAGLPGIAIGHNDQIAWGVTSLEGDVQDLYVEKFDPTNPQRYMTPAGWRDAEVRHEEIKVRKGFLDTATDTTPFDVTVTRHGPIILEQSGKRYALQWTALAPTANLLEGFYLMNTAHNWNEFSNAFKNYNGPPFNMVYADTRGHIGYYGVGQFPIRKGDGKIPYDGSTDEGEWHGFIPFNKLPHVVDPANGIIVTANTRVVGLDYPYALTVVTAPAYRARRIYDLLNSKPKHSIEDFRAIQGDTFTISGATFAQEFVKTLVSAMGGSHVEHLREDYQMLKAWDGRVVPDSRAALLVAHMRANFRKRIITAALGPESAQGYAYSNVDTFVDRVVMERAAEWLPHEFGDYGALFMACFWDAHQELTRSYGEDETKWTWGREAQVRFPHPLAQAPIVGLQFIIPPFPQNGAVGSLPTINRGASVSMRLIADPNDWDRTQQGIALGESGNPASPHWSDQLADWRAVTPHVFPFTKQAVASATRETLVLEPGAR